MEIENQILSNILSKNIIKEIGALPMEFREKSEEVTFLQNELNELKQKFNKRENQIEKLSKEIINIENNLSTSLEEISNIKSEQKLIIDSINEESFKSFTNNFYKIPKNIQEIILIFLKYEGELKEELNFLLIKPELLNSLLRDSYSYFKSIEESDKEKYESCRDKIKNIKNGNNFKFNGNHIGNKLTNNKFRLEKPFDNILIFIENTFKIVDTNNYNKEMANNIKEKSSYKDKLFIENKLLQNEIKEKQEKLKNINTYIKHINNILIKYKNFFGNSNSSKNSNSSNIKNSYNNKYDNIENDNIILINKKPSSFIKKEDLKENDKIILSSNPNINKDDRIISNNNNKNDKIIFKSNNNKNEKFKINNRTEKILLKSCIGGDEMHRNNLYNFDFMENKNNNFYYDVNNCKKKSIISSTDPSSSNNLINNPNNIKIISIITSSNKNPQSPNISSNINIDDNNKINSVSIDYLNNNGNINNNSNVYSNVNPNEGKKIKIGSLAMYQSTTSKNFKNKIIKTNSFEQSESKKIFINNPSSNNKPNRSHITNDEIQKEENDKKINKEQYKDRNINRDIQQPYFSYQSNDEASLENKSLKNYIIKVQKIKQESDKKNIDNNYINNNIILDYKQNGNNENIIINNNKRKNVYLSPQGIYNNKNKKILKMFEMNKNNEKIKNNKYK